MEGRADEMKMTEKIQINQNNTDVNIVFICNYVLLSLSITSLFGNFVKLVKFTRIAADRFCSSQFSEAKNTEC